MTLYELMNNIQLQGDVKIRVFTGDYEEKAMKKYKYVDDLSVEDIPEDWEDLEVRFIYIADGCLTIELYMEDDE